MDPRKLILGKVMQLEQRYEVKPEERQLQDVGERMMDLGCKLDDHVKANQYSIIGNHLANAGALFEKRYPKDFNEQQLSYIHEVARSMCFKC